MCFIKKVICFVFCFLNTILCAYIFQQDSKNTIGVLCIIISSFMWYFQQMGLGLLFNVIVFLVVPKELLLFFLSDFIKSCTLMFIETLNFYKKSFEKYEEILNITRNTKM